MRHNTELTYFFEANSKKLFFYLLKMTNSREDAEDIFQDTFIKYAKKYPHELSAPLLFTVAKSVFTDMVRKRRDCDELDEGSAASGGDPESALLEKRSGSRVQRAFDSLDMDSRNLLSMTGQDGMSYAEIASATGLSEGNVKVKIFRARLKLKEILEKTDE